jgi:protein TonB
LRLAAPSLEPAPEHGLLPVIEITAPPIDIAPRLAERPAPRPLEATRQETVTRQIAAGTAKGANRGSSQSAAPRASDAAQRSATAAWAAAIQKSIAHHHIYPRGTNDEGRVRVAMVVLPNGALARVSVARSSGSAALDKAAIVAVKRAAPFPPAPKGLDDQWYDIGQWISFERR